MKHLDMDRRKFLGGSAAAVATCACAAAGLAGCSTTNPQAKPVTAKAGAGGRLDLGPASALGVGQQLKVSVPGVEDPVLVARVSETEVRAVSIACTHWGSEMELVLAEQQFRCTNHGSLFDYDGQVLEGPASDPLPTYQVLEENGHLFLITPGA
jgi:Rieske Fe-S protein